MGDLLIHGIDEKVIETYKERARNKGTSLEVEIRDLIHMHGQPPLTPEERVAISRAIRSRTKGMVPPLSAEERREGLE